MSRANRRRHNKRLKKKRSHYWGGKTIDPVIIGKKMAAPKPASGCPCCINPRRLGEVTRQEQAADLKEQETQE